MTDVCKCGHSVDCHPAFADFAYECDKCHCTNYEPLAAPDSAQEGDAKCKQDHETVLNANTETAKDTATFASNSAPAPASTGVGGVSNLTLLAGAIRYATHKHDGVMDNTGREPYIFHCLRVMLAMEDDTEAQIVAVLHDVVEDCVVRVGEIRVIWGDEVADAVDAISRREGEKYFDYIVRCAENPIACKVKLADLHDNKFVRGEIPPSLTKRYTRATEILTGANHT